MPLKCSAGLEHSMFVSTRFRVRRALFQSLEQPGEAHDWIQEDLEDLKEEQKKRWNFDFENEIPLEGRYQWEPVGSSQKENKSEEDRPAVISNEDNDGSIHDVSRDITQTLVTDYFRTQKLPNSKLKERGINSAENSTDHVLLAL